MVEKFLFDIWIDVICSIIKNVIDLEARLFDTSNNFINHKWVQVKYRFNLQQKNVTIDMQYLVIFLFYFCMSRKHPQACYWNKIVFLSDHSTSYPKGHFWLY